MFRSGLRRSIAELGAQGSKLRAELAHFALEPREPVLGRRIRRRGRVGAIRQIGCRLAAARRGKRRLGLRVSAKQLLVAILLLTRAAGMPSDLATLDQPVDGRLD